MPDSARELTIEELALKIEENYDSKQHSADHAWCLLGQERVVKALEMGMAIHAQGYNIFVVGDPAIEMQTAVMEILSRQQEKNHRLRDIVYVPDFTQADKPLPLILPPGEARRLKKDTQSLIKRLREHIAKVTQEESTYRENAQEKPPADTGVYSEKTPNINKLRTIKALVEKECTLISSGWADDAVKSFFKSLEEDVRENCAIFMEQRSEAQYLANWEGHYEVHIVLDRYGVEKSPIIHEINPTKTNLLGSIESRYDTSGESQTGITIRAGSLLKADGGFLIIHAEEVFSSEGLWPELKRILQSGYLIPENPSTPLGPLPVLLSPEAVKIHSTVILLGSIRRYESLCQSDEDFLGLFKLIAEFNPVMPWNKKAEQGYATFVYSFAARENLRDVSSSAIREIIAYAVRLAESRNRLSTQFVLIGDLLREAEYEAEQSGKSIIDGELIRKTIEIREYVGNLQEEMMIEQIHEGSLLIDVQGRKIGTINGLAVLERGHYAYGTPLCITASIAPGKDGLVNIEREAGLSGALHDKGIFLLEGYLRYRYARHQNICLSASIAIEQSFYDIDGDSASAAELAALLSAIADIPVRQDIAVTGAVNQQGMIQTVGGIYEKIQAFYKTCQARGFTGHQGVVLPLGNNIILPDKVLEAVREGRFHIWIVRDMDQLMSLLMGMPSGKKRKNGRFQPRSINEKIRQALMELADLS